VISDTELFRDLSVGLAAFHGVSHLGAPIGSTSPPLNQRLRYHTVILVFPVDSSGIGRRI
jgi:hypothetical protein